MIISEDDVDNVGCACDVCRHGGAAVLLHQGCPIPIPDWQVDITGSIAHCHVVMKYDRNHLIVR